MFYFYISGKRQKTFGEIVMTVVIRIRNNLKLWLLQERTIKAR